MSEDLKVRFREAAAAHGAGTASGDCRATNAAYDEMIAVVGQLRMLGDKGGKVLTSLLTDSDAGVRSCAAAYLLPLDENAAILTLEEVAASREPLIGMSAAMTLREWRAGRLKLP